MTRRGPVLLACAAALGAVLLAGCAGPERLEVRAVFDDVVDLTSRAHVKIADVPVGVVSDIALTDDHRALVTMRLDDDVALPAQVSARLRKTNVLGERFVELVPEPGSGGTFASGSTITDTSVVPELEEVVAAGSDLLAAVAADRLAVAIEAGAEGLGGRGHTLGGLLDDVGDVVATYDRNSADLVRLVDGLSAFLADAGPQAELHGEAVAEVARATRMLADEDERLLDALADVRGLSRTGSDIIVTHRQRIDAFFTRFDAIAAEIAGREEDLHRLFPELHKHNHNTIRGINAEFAQVILDFIVCGQNDEPGHPIRACEDPPQARARPEPRPPVAGYGRPAR